MNSPWRLGRWLAWVSRSEIWMVQMPSSWARAAHSPRVWGTAVSPEMSRRRSSRARLTKWETMPGLAP